MNPKFVIIGTMRYVTYFVKLNKVNAMGGFTFQGLINNATKFDDYEVARNTMKYLRSESKLPLNIITVKN